MRNHRNLHNRAILDLDSKQDVTTDMQAHGNPRVLRSRVPQGNIVSRDSDNDHWMHLSRLREHSKVPDCTDYSGGNETATNLSF